MKIKIVTTTEIDVAIGLGTRFRLPLVKIYSSEGDEYIIAKGPTRAPFNDLEAVNLASGSSRSYQWVSVVNKENVTLDELRRIASNDPHGRPTSDPIEILHEGKYIRVN